MATDSARRDMPSGVSRSASTIRPRKKRRDPRSSPAGFEAFIAEAGEPAAEPVVPPPAEPDIAKLLTTQARAADETPLLQGGRKPYLVVAIRTYPEP